MTTELQRRSITAGCYHADIHANQKTSVHKQWIANELQVLQFIDAVFKPRAPLKAAYLSHGALIVVVVAVVVIVQWR